MNTVTIQEAKTHLSRLIDQAASGEPFVIAEAGRPLVKVIPIDAAEGRPERRLGFLAGEGEVPDDFDRMGLADVERLFGPDL